MIRPTLATVAALAALVGVLGGTSTARAVEVYYTPNGPVVLQTPPRQVLRPHRYLYVDPQVLPPPQPVTVRVVQPPPPTRVVVRTVSPPPPTRVVIAPTPTYEEPRVDPYDTDGRVIVGAGFGAMAFFRDGEQHFAPGYKLSLGLALDQAEFGMHFDFVPDAMDVPGDDGESLDAAVYTARAQFQYRLAPRATVHPVVGIGLETIFLNPDGAETGTAFAGTARLGLEFAYPLASGALALGVDATVHQPFGTTQSYRADPATMLSFGAYGNYRF